MKKETSADPVIGPTENKVPTRMSIKHEDLPGLDSASLGDRVKFTVVGKIVSNRAADEYGDGSTEVEVSSIENAEPVKKENAATMHLDKLKAKLPKKEDTADEKVDKKAGVEEKGVETEEKD
jgi:hypothetical protein